MCWLHCCQIRQLSAAPVCTLKTECRTTSVAGVVRIVFRRRVTSWYQSREELTTDLCWSTGPLPGDCQAAWQAVREFGFLGLLAQSLSAIEAAPGSSVCRFSTCPSSCLGWGYPAPWFPCGEASSLATSSVPSWQPGNRLGDTWVPLRLVGSAWHPEGPRNRNLSCCLIWKNSVLFWWCFFLVSCL